MLLLFDKQKKQNSWTALLCRVVFAFLLFGSKTALADDCMGAGGAIPVALPGSVTVSRDTPVGEIIGVSVLSVANNNLYQCRSPHTLGYRVDSPLAQRPYASDNQNNNIYDTNVKGIGLAIDYQLICNPGENNVDKINWVSASQSSICKGLASQIGARVRVALVKTGHVVSGTISAGTVLTLAGIRYFSGTSIAPPYSVTIGQVVVIGDECNVEVDPNPVDLGTYGVADFKGGSGSATTPVPFKIDLIGCPAGMNLIKYQINSNAPYIDQAGLVTLDSTSTATGLNIQLLDGRGNPFPLASDQTLDSYNGKEGHYEIPLQARYVQTGAKVTPGTASTSLTFTINFE